MKIAFFDFDGTITRADTMLGLIKFHFGSLKFYLGMMMISTSLIGLKLGLLSRQIAKEKLLSHFFAGMKVAEFDEICRSFSAMKMPKLLRVAALKRLEQLKSEGAAIVVVTASASNWVKFWCAANGLPYLSSELEVNDGKLTGKLDGLNCNEEEKVNRIKASYSLEEFDEIECYGDSSGDKAMLAIATHPYYKKFG